MLGHLKNGRLELPEDAIRTALEDILAVPFKSEHSPAELNDLYTANVKICGRHVPTAFMLKGPGVRTPKLEIKHCGKTGNQLVKLFDSPAELFVIQFVGNVSEHVIKDVEQKTEARRAAGKPASFLVLNGQDTARLLMAYGKL